MLSKPGTFRNLVRFEPVVFLERIAKPLFRHVDLPRGYLLRADYQATGLVARRRRCQIGDLDRLVRYILRMRGVPVTMLAYLYDQHPSTIQRDVKHIAFLITDKLYDEYLRSIPVGSAEYLRLIGNNAFRHFPNALYAVDVVKCRRRRPSDLGHTAWYDGHKKQYDFGYLCCVDSEGICRNIHGHFSGSTNDIAAYYHSDLYQHPQRYFGANDKMLADGIFAGAEGGNGPFILPFCYLHRNLTRSESRYNLIQRWDRSIVEHFFGR